MPHPTPPRSSPVAGLVLAGGQGRRMGGADKGLLLHRGRPLVEQAMERLAPQVSTLLVSANRNLPRYAALAATHGGTVLTDTGQTLPTVAQLSREAQPDLREGEGAAPVCRGPLAGMLAGLSHLAGMLAGSTRLAGMLAGLSHLADMRARLPHLPADGPAHWLAVVPCDLPDLPPQHVQQLLHAATSHARPAAVARVAGRLQPTVCLLHLRLLDDLQQALSQGRLAAGRWLQSVDACPVDSADAAAFRNLNTPEDLAA